MAFIKMSNGTIAHIMKDGGVRRVLPKLTKEQQEQLFADRINMMTYRELAQKYNQSESGVRNLCRKHNIEPRVPIMRRVKTIYWTEERKAELQKMWNDGVDIRLIMLHFGGRTEPAINAALSNMRREGYNLRTVSKKHRYAQTGGIITPKH